MHWTKKLKNLSRDSAILTQEITVHIAGAGPKTTRACNSDSSDNSRNCTGLEVCWDHTTPDMATCECVDMFNFIMQL